MVGRPGARKQLGGDRSPMFRGNAAAANSGGRAGCGVLWLRGRWRGAAPGTANHNSSLSAAEVREIHRLATAGAVTYQVIAEQFGVSRITVSRIKRGLRYQEEVMPP